MNKSELLAELATKYYKVGVITNAETNPTGLSIRQTEGVNWYLVGVYDVLGDTMERKNVPIYVANEGTKDEQAFYSGTVPESKAEAKVRAELAAIESAKIAPIKEV
jgi:hypothetical protein